MKTLNKLIVIILGLVSASAAKKFLNKYEVLIFDKEDLDKEDPEQTALDLRGTPTHVCVCGSNIWYVKTVFEDYEISTYFLDMLCASCGNIATAPTLVDRENME
jgi:hypothetical protein